MLRNPNIQDDSFRKNFLRVPESTVNSFANISAICMFLSVSEGLSGHLLSYLRPYFLTSYRNWKTSSINFINIFLKKKLLNDKHNFRKHCIRARTPKTCPNNLLAERLIAQSHTGAPCGTVVKKTVN